jgi:hypothetical protein
MQTLLAALTALLLASALAGCVPMEQSLHESQAADTEQVLREAGFRMIPGDTKPRIDMLHALPPRTFTAVTRDGRPWYVYADPSNCACLYVGNPASFQKYQRLARERDLLYEETVLADDTVFGWAAWGPWY